VLGSIVDLQFLDNATRFGRLEGFIYTPRG
jgi:hypothetical protein